VVVLAQVGGGHGHNHDGMIWMVRCDFMIIQGTAWRGAANPPGSGENRASISNRRCRCAQPPANCWEPCEFGDGSMAAIGQRVKTTQATERSQAVRRLRRSRYDAGEARRRHS
jgi:hypothetical protein